MIQFNASKSERKLITKIAQRAEQFAAFAGIKYDVLDASMDIEACHCNGCPLDLGDLQFASDEDFGHDVLGIRRHLNRKTGQLGGCFHPRYATPVNTATT
jgi:hypothetical protein